MNPSLPIKKNASMLFSIRILKTRHHLSSKIRTLINNLKIYRLKYAHAFSRFELVSAETALADFIWIKYK